MSYGNRWMVAALMAACPLLWACSESASAKAEKNEPAKLERVEGQAFGKITLTEKAAQRLDVQTAKVRVESVARKAAEAEVAALDATGQPLAAVRPAAATQERKIVPYASVVYEPHGATWVYTNPEPLVFIRQKVAIDYIDGDAAVLSEGPPAGTNVVTVGVAELFGIEFGVK